MKTLLNLVLMQVTWFACVLGAANHLPWIGTGVAVVVAMAHVLRATQPLIEGKLILSALVMGLVIDSALASSGLITFTSGVWFVGLTTHWMLGLWIGFATALTSSLSWLMMRPVFAAAFGAIGGPLAYASGEKLGAIHVEGVLGLFAIGIGWALAMTAFSLLVRHLSLPAPLQESLV